MSALRGWAAFGVPAAILAAAWLLAAYAAAWPPAYAAMAEYAPGFAVVLAALLAAAFQRGRIFFALLTLAAAYLAYRGYLARSASGLAARAVFAALCLLVPLNLAALAFSRERGIFNLHGLLRAAILLLQCGAVAWFAAAGHRETVDWLYQPLTALLPAASRIPHAGLMVMAAGMLTCMVLWWRSRSAMDFAFAGAIAAWGIAAHGLAQREWHIVFTVAAILMLAIAVLQDVYRMAFRDELTGVPARRALNEHLARLGRRFVIAVIDIDHFKKFNDTHGHDVGDQVLKMVATRIERVRGGGSAYRFGGEEFVIVFPGAGIAQALPHLDALRADVAKHGLTLRAPDRAPPSSAPAVARAKPKRAARSGGKKLSVTISIGVAERSDKLTSPSEVLAAADRALYRAKRAGRDRVSR